MVKELIALLVLYVVDGKILSTIIHIPIYFVINFIVHKFMYISDTKLLIAYLLGAVFINYLIDKKLDNLSKRYNNLIKRVR